MQFTPIVAFGVGFAIGLVLGLAWLYLRTFRKVATSLPSVVQRVGEQTPVRGALLYKPRFTQQIQWVAGTVAYTHSATCFRLGGGASPVTRAVPARASVQDFVIGVAPGDDSLTLSGANDTGEAHDPITIPIKILPAQTPFSVLFAAAAKAFNDPFFNGWVNNVLGGVKCDEWADWMAEWIPLHAGDEICRVEKIIYHPQLTQRPIRIRHVAVRIMYCDGRIMYLDPWRFGDDRPERTQADYERSYGPPDDAFQVWSR